MSNALNYLTRRVELFGLFLQGKAAFIDFIPTGIVVPFLVARKRDKQNVYLSVRGKDLFLVGNGLGYPPEIVYRDLLQFIAEIYTFRVSMKLIKYNYH